MQRLWTGCKRSLHILVVGLFLASPVFGAAPANRPPVPNPRGYVNDFANVLDAQAEAQLTAISESLAQATTAQMVFVTVSSIAPYDDFTYGMAIFDAWKIGQKGKDNGLLIMIAIKERRIRILTGYGLEGILPDGKLGRYRDEYLIPYLKQNKMGAGMINLGLACAQDIAKAAGVKLDINEQPRRFPRSQGRKPSGTRIIVLLGLLVLLSIVSRLNRRRLGGYRSGGVYIPGGYYRSGGGGFGGGFSGFGGGFSGGGGVGGSW